ncbi:MAG: SGNH/GDSL hydrolase family protein [Chloroflexota bacterium]
MAHVWRNRVTTGIAVQGDPPGRPYRVVLFVFFFVLLGAGYSVNAQEGIPAQVINTDQTVNAYVLPEESTGVLMLLNGGMQITALGRSMDNAWVKADLYNGIVGWVPYTQIETGDAYALDTLPVTQPDEEMILQYAPFWNFDTAQNRAIFERGRAAGRTMNGFSKVGDSITAAQMYLTPYGSGVYNLGEFEYLSHVLDYFGTDSSSSFGQRSVAVAVGWSTRDVLNPNKATAGCPLQMSPLVCEYNTRKPAFALIMLGTNDATVMDVAEFEENLGLIVQTTIDADIVPVLSTVPPLLLPEWNERPYNYAIIRVAQAYDVSLMNYWLAMQQLPNLGMSPDLIHPSTPPSNAGTTLFTGEYIQYGYTMRNLVTLQGFDYLLRNSVYPTF